MMTSFLTPFLTSDKNADQNIAESDHQRNFCKKPHVKSSFRSEEDRSRSDRHTHRQILLFIIWTRADARRPIAPSAIPLSAIPIYAQYMTLAININGVSLTGSARQNQWYLRKPNNGYFQPQIKHWRRRVGKNLTTCTWKQILRSFILWFFRRSNPIFRISNGSRDMERCLNTTFEPKHPFLAIFGHYMPHLLQKLAEIVNFAGDSSAGG